MVEPLVLPPYPQSLAGRLLAAREAVMAPIRPILRAAGMTDQQWRVVRVLSEAEGPLDASTVAEAALLHAPSVTRVVRELEDRGLLSRAIDPNDRRRSVIAISEAGEALVRDTAAQTSIMLSRYGEAFGEERLAAFIAEAAALSEALSAFAPSDAASARGAD